MEAVRRRKGTGYCRLIRPRIEKGDRQVAPKNHYQNQHSGKYSAKAIPSFICR